MDLDRLPIKTLFGKFGGHPRRGRPPKTWLEYVRDDLIRLLELQGHVEHIFFGDVCAEIGMSGQRRFARWLRHTPSPRTGNV